MAFCGLNDYKGKKPKVFPKVKPLPPGKGQEVRR
jgi:hypothetical protein